MEIDFTIRPELADYDQAVKELRDQGATEGELLNELAQAIQTRAEALARQRLGVERILRTCPERQNS